MTIDFNEYSISWRRKGRNRKEDGRYSLRENPGVRSKVVLRRLSGKKEQQQKKKDGQRVVGIRREREKN